MAGFYLILHCSHFHTMNTFWIFFLNLRQIGILSRIMTRNAFALHSWMNFWLRFLRFDFELFQMHMHYYLISIDYFGHQTIYCPGGGAHLLTFFGNPSHLLVVEPLD